MSFRISILGTLICGLTLAATAQEMCPPRPRPGDPISNPLELKSQNGVLKLDLALKSEISPGGSVHYCYVYMNGNTPVEAPTMRVNPGDQIITTFRNEISVVEPKVKLKSRHAPIEPMDMGDVKLAKLKGDPCLGGTVDATATNIHWHGLNIPPVCHQDEVVNTVIPNDGVPFEYAITVPANDPPGMYWYHPHPHGFTTPQVFGGAAGALIINGNNPLTDGLPERQIIIRQNPDAITDEDGQFTVNFEVANYPRQALPSINIKAGQKEYWRVLNASTRGFLELELFSGAPQQLLLISLDGIPLPTPIPTTTISLPPAGRAEFIVPPQSASGFLWTKGFDAGPIGDQQLPTRLATVLVSGSKAPEMKVAQAPPPKVAPRFSGLGSVKPSGARKLYFSEVNVGTNGPTEFFITVEGQQPRVFDPMNPPAIETKLGTVEDWIIENRSAEVHAFHIHQVHFLLLEENGQPLAEPPLIDTQTVEPWDGHSPYPSIKVRMDFRDPEIAGEFVYHCHILDHEDGGMMATIVVKP